MDGELSSYRPPASGKSFFTRPVTGEGVLLPEGRGGGEPSACLCALSVPCQACPSLCARTAPPAPVRAAVRRGVHRVTAALLAGGGPEGCVGRGVRPRSVHLPWSPPSSAGEQYCPALPAKRGAQEPPRTSPPQCQERSTAGASTRLAAGRRGGGSEDRFRLRKSPARVPTRPLGLATASCALSRPSVCSADAREQLA